MHLFYIFPFDALNILARPEEVKAPHLQLSQPGHRKWAWIPHPRVELSLTCTSKPTPHQSLSIPEEGSPPHPFCT